MTEAAASRADKAALRRASCAPGGGGLPDPALPRSTVSRLGCSLLVGVSLVVLICILPMANVVEQDDLFMCLLAVCMSSLENCLIRPFTHLKI